MKRRPGKTAKEPGHSIVDRRFAQLVDTFSGYPNVTCGDGKGFGSGALRVNNKIFAMVSSKGELVVKLSKKRVDELTAAGSPFPPDDRTG